jgi:hypothetical protein
MRAAVKESGLLDKECSSTPQEGFTEPVPRMSQDFSESGISEPH